MFPRHEEFVGIVNATEADAFAHLDDQTRLSAHMSRRSWKMGWGKMSVDLDKQGGKTVGSHIVLRGRVLGLSLYLHEVVTERNPPRQKLWRTVGEPRLLVIGAYEMGFELSPATHGVRLRVTIDYEWPTKRIQRLLGRLFGRMYAKWCTRQMVQDAQKSFPAISLTRRER
jgi:hypothetical protein